MLFHILQNHILTRLKKKHRSAKMHLELRLPRDPILDKQKQWIDKFKSNCLTYWAVRLHMCVVYDFESDLGLSVLHCKLPVWT